VIAEAGEEDGSDTPTSADLEDCFEQALTASKRPRMTNPAIIAIFCWRDQDESIEPEKMFERVLLLFRFVEFQRVAMSHLPLRGAVAQGRGMREANPRRVDSAGVSAGTARAGCLPRYTLV
jgi:hypothetical protein